MTDDVPLLRRYAHDRSEAAFAELVRRHLGWVYRTALRRTGGRSDLAQDVAQYVFIALAKQAAALADRDQLSGWFYTTIRNAAYQLLRAEARRRVHESAAAMNLDEDSSPDMWASLRPTLDQAGTATAAVNQQSAARAAQATGILNSDQIAAVRAQAALETVFGLEDQYFKTQPYSANSTTTPSGSSK